MHLGRVLAQWGFLPTSFVLERKHKEVKRFGHDRESKISFEKGIMADTTVRHIKHFEGMANVQITDVHLEHPILPPTKTLEILRKDFPRVAAQSAVVSRTALVHSRAIVGGDVYGGATCSRSRRTGEVLLYG